MRTKLLQKMPLIVVILKMKEVFNLKKTVLSIILMRTKLLQKMLLIVVVLEMKEAFNLKKLCFKYFKNSCPVR